MKKVVIISLVSILYILSGIKVSKSEDNQNQKPDLIPANSNELNVDRCKIDFKLCIDISEAANTIGYVYKNGRSQEKTREDAIRSLTSRENCKTNSCDSDATWHQGYKEDNVKFIDKQAKVDKDNIFDAIDVQAIVAEKTYSEGGQEKKKFLITIKGTEEGTDWITNARARVRSIDIGNSAEVPMGFLNSAQVLMSTPEFQDILKKIKSASDDGVNFEVLVTGHSLGGATATTVKAYIEDSLPETAKRRVSAITFGSPLAGNQKFNELYGNRVTAIHIEGDIVSSLGSDNAISIGQSYTFKMPESQANIQRKINEPISWWEFNKQIERLSLLKDLASESIATHAQGYHNQQRYGDRYKAARETGWYDLRNELMHQQLQAITMGSSSHIGSAAYYIGRTPYEDSVTTEDAIKVQQFSGARTPSLQQQAEFIDSNNFILKAPVDVVLNWDQSMLAGQLDLDSHLTGPTGLGENSPIRFHTRFDDRGSLNSPPYALLYRDVIPATGDSGPEQTRIQFLQDGVYRFYVHDYTNRDTDNSPALSASSATVQFFNNGKDLPDNPGENLGDNIGGTIEVPKDQVGNVWYVFQLDTRTGILKRVNVPFGNESDRSRVPRIGEP